MPIEVCGYLQQEKVCICLHSTRDGKRNKNKLQVSPKTERFRAGQVDWENQ
jgi:hypothetical protein